MDAFPPHSLLCASGREGGPVEEVWGQLGRALLGLRLTVYSTVLCGMPADVCVCDLGYAGFVGKRRACGSGLQGRGFSSYALVGG